MLRFMYGIQDSPSRESGQASPSEHLAETLEDALEEASEGAPGEHFYQPPDEPPQDPIGETSRDNFGGHTKPVSKGRENKLISHVRTNAIADYYNVPKLCNLANKEIALLFQTEWSPVEFLEASKVVSSSTGDKNLHHMFAKIAAEHVQELLDYADNFAGLLALDGFTLQFMKDSADRIATLKNLLNFQAKHLIEAEKVKGNMGECVQKLENTKSCRHCQANFDCYIETPDNKTYTLRCAKCFTRHKS